MPRAMSVSSDDRSSPPSGLLEQGLPELVVVERRPHVPGSAQRLGHRREEQPGDGLQSLGELREPRRLTGAAGHAGEGVGGGRGIRCVDQDAPRGVVRIGRVGGVAAAPQPDAEPEVVDDAAGEQAHEVGVARQSCGDARPRLLRHRGTPEMVEPLEHDDRPPGPRQVRRGDEGVVAAADDGGVIHGGGDGSGHGVTLPRPPALARAAPAVRGGRPSWSASCGSAVASNRSTGLPQEVESFQPPVERG